MSFLNETGMANQAELLAVLSAVLLSPALPLFHVALLILFHKTHGLMLMGLALLCYVGCWFVLLLYIKDGSMPGLSEWVVGCSLAGFLFLSYAQVYSLACRSVSLHIVMDIYRNGSLTLEECSVKYNQGRGVAWLVEGRLAGLAALGMVRRHGDMVELCSVGGRIAGRLGWLAKSVLKLGKAG